MSKFGVMLSGLAAMFVLTVPTIAEEGEAKQDESKKLTSELRSVNGKVTAMTQKLIKANPEYKKEYDALRAKRKELEELQSALYAKIAEKDPGLKELVDKMAELTKKRDEMRKANAKGKAKPKVKGKAKPKVKAKKKKEEAK